jgi:hypothetical protein
MTANLLKPAISKNYVCIKYVSDDKLSMPCNEDLVVVT